MEVTPKNFFTHLMFHPNHADTEKQKRNTFITTIALGVLSFGVIHLFCRLFFYDKNVVQKEGSEEVDKKTKDVFEKAITSDEELEMEIPDSPSSIASEATEYKNPANTPEVEPEIPPVETVLNSDQTAIAKKSRNQGIDLLEAGTQLFKKAESLTGKDKELKIDEAKILCEAAVTHLSAGANLGDCKAQFQLGALYHHGDYVAKDIPKALKYYELSETQGYHNAQLNLGVLLYEGEDGVEKNEKRGIELILAAALQDNEQANKTLENLNVAT